MSKKDEFKHFASSHPELNEYVRKGDMTWQKFYEMYDIYGEDNRGWDKYITSTNSEIKTSSIPKILNNIDMNSIQEHINTAQKALGVIQELTSKKEVPKTSFKGPTTQRPINKFFED